MNRKIHQFKIVTNNHKKKYDFEDELTDFPCYLKSPKLGGSANNLRFCMIERNINGIRT